MQAETIFVLLKLDPRLSGESFITYFDLRQHKVDGHHEIISISGTKIEQKKYLHFESKWSLYRPKSQLMSRTRNTDLTAIK